MDFIENVGRRSSVEGDTSSLVNVGIQSLNGNERNALYRNLGSGSFVECGWITGTDRTEDGRGLAVADFDNDGDEDLLLNNYLAPATLLMNPGSPGHHWLQLDLVGTRSNRDAIGARVVVRHDGRVQQRQVATARGYLSGQTSRIHFGLGASRRVSEVEIHWPSGVTESIRDIRVDQRLRVVEGSAPSSQAVRTAMTRPR